MKLLFGKKYLVFLLVVFSGIAAWTVFHTLFLNKNSNVLHPGNILKSHFVGSIACKECHLAEYEAWKKSDHYKAMQVANEETVQGDFSNVIFQSKGFTNKMFKRDSSFYMILENRKGQADTFEVKYTFGYFPLQQYIIEFPDGRYQCTHIAWDSRKKKWFDLYPNLMIDHSEWLHWTGGSQTWNNMCADCHSTNLRKNYQIESHSYKTTFSEIDVSCEACHGPGSEHVSLSKMYPDSTRVFGTVYLGTGSGQQEQIQMCARCHSRRSQLNNSFSYNEHWLQQYDPSILLPGLYYADGQIQDEVYVWGSFAQSKMYQKGVRCVDCHDPHTYKRRLPGNQLCGQCHDSRLYDNEEHHFHQPGTDGALCESCHMPGQRYMVNDYRPDHSFRVPRPDLSVKYDVPNACNKCHSNQSTQWASEWVNRWYGNKRNFHYSEILVKAANHKSSSKEIAHLVCIDTVPDIVKATAIHYLEYYAGSEAKKVLLNCLTDSSVIIRKTAVEGLSLYNSEELKSNFVQLLNDTARVVRLAAFNALAGTNISLLSPSDFDLYKKVNREFLSTYAGNTDFPSGNLFLAQYYHRTGEMDMAEKYYQSTLEMDNYQNLVRMNLAAIYNMQNKNEKSAALLRKVVEQEPEYDQAWYSLGLLYAEMSRIDSAVVCLKRCVQLNPQNVTAYYNLGLVFQQQNKIDNAESVFKEGLRQNAESEKLLYAIAFFYLKQEKLMLAKKYAEKLVRIYPDRIEYRQLLMMTER